MRFITLKCVSIIFLVSASRKITHKNTKNYFAFTVEQRGVEIKHKVTRYGYGWVGRVKKGSAKYG
jgi:hypothetical protein